MAWKDIPGYKTPYRINELGEIQQFLRGKWRPVSHTVTPRRTEVRLRATDGTQKRVGVFRLLDIYFFNGFGAKNGLCVGPKNGVRSECTIENLAYRSQSDIGRSALSRSARKAVARYDTRGNVVLYKSVTEAARKNGLSLSALDRRIYGGVLDPHGHKFEIIK